MAAREGTCAKVAAETGATFIPPYDYGPVIAGQGTMGLELLQQVLQRRSIGHVAWAVTLNSIVYRGVGLICSPNAELQSTALLPVSPFHHIQHEQL